jgi:CheY-like chemotaxis protein
MSRRILLADDSLTIQKVIELTFMDEDYEVTAVSNGDEALRLLQETEPDFVIADVHMPGANGYEVCRQAKQRFAGIPVLLLVGTFEPFDEGQSRSVGADAFLKKPFDSQELLQLVGQLLSARGGDAGSRLEDTFPTAPAAAPAWEAFEVEPAAEEAAAPASPAAPNPFETRFGGGFEPFASASESAPEPAPPAFPDPSPWAAPPVEDWRTTPATPLAPGTAFAAEEAVFELDPIDEEPVPFALQDEVPELPPVEPQGFEPEASPYELAPEAAPPAALPWGHGNDEPLQLDDSYVLDAGSRWGSPEPPAPEPMAPEPFALEDPVQDRVPEPIFSFEASREVTAEHPLYAAPAPAAPSYFAEPEPFAPEPEPTPAPEPAAAVAEPVAAAEAGPVRLSEEDVDRIARRIVELIGDKPVREVAWEVIPDMAEVVIKGRLRELEAQVE